MKRKEYISPAIRVVSLDPEESMMLNAISGGDINTDETDDLGNSNRRRNSIWGGED